MKQNYYKVLLFIWGICLLQMGTSQMLNTNLIIIKPSAYISEWNAPTTGRLIIVNSGTQSISQVKIHYELKDENGQILIQSNMLKQEDYFLNSGVTTFTIGQFFSMDNAIVNSSTQKTLINTAKLKAGVYQLNVQLFKDSIGAYVPASSIQTKMFTIHSYQLPVLTAPFNEQVVNADISKSILLFRWTPVQPTSTETIKYILKVTEVLDDQSVLQALQTNAPLLEKEILRVTQYIWQPMLNLHDAQSKKFVWTIQTIDSQGNPVESVGFNANAISVPSIFYVQPASKNKITTQ